MKIKAFLKKYLPLPALIILILAVVSVIIHAFAVIFPDFAELFNGTVAGFFRLVLAKISGVIPISIAELMIILLPLIITLIIIFSIKAYKKGRQGGVRFLVMLFAVLTLFYSSFVFTFACGYRGHTLQEKLSLNPDKVSASDLDKTARVVMTELNKVVAKTQYDEGNFSINPNNYHQTNKKLNTAYALFAEKYTFIQNFKSNVKPIMLSKPMTYTHISGVYTFFTGEANVNTNFPSYTLPYTMAHEMAHQRGIAREDEANFVAYLVCLESDDNYIRYSAYLNMFEYLSNALYKADREMYKELISDLDERVVKELIAYSDFFDKYRDNIAANVSGAVNNSYLQSQGQVAGTKSYGLVVDLAVAYYKK